MRLNASTFSVEWIEWVSHERPLAEVPSEDVISFSTHNIQLLFHRNFIKTTNSPQLNTYKLQLSESMFSMCCVIHYYFANLMDNNNMLNNRLNFRKWPKILESCVEFSASRTSNCVGWTIRFSMSQILMISFYNNPSRDWFEPFWKDDSELVNVFIWRNVFIFDVINYIGSINLSNQVLFYEVSSSVFQLNIPISLNQSIVLYPKMNISP